MNFLIQSTAAAHLKHMMLVADRAGVPLVSTVHDELIAEVHHSDAREVKSALHRAFTETIEMDVPLTAAVRVGKNWRELKG